MKFWVRIYKDNKLMCDAVCDTDIALSPAKMLEDGLKKCCYELDLSNPIIMKKHITDIRMYSLTRFLPDDFPESVDFDKMEINVFDDSKNKKRI